MSIGLLILRVVVGGLMAGHGLQKLFGWFGGHGLRGTGKFLESLGFRPGRRWAPIHGLAETAGGALVLLGFLTPLGAAAIIAVMIVASVVVHGDKGLWNTNGGYELPLLFAAAASALAFTGPGVVSVDRAIGWSPSGPLWGFGAVVLGVAVAAAVMATRRVVREAVEEAEERSAA